LHYIKHHSIFVTKTMSSPTTNEVVVRDAIRAIIAPMPIDKIIGQPTNLTVNLLKQKVAKIAAAVKTTSWGRRHGHLALILDDDEYRFVTGNASHTTTRLVAPPIVPMALANSPFAHASQPTTTSSAKSSGSRKLSMQSSSTSCSRRS
jgi:hypothetical protein